MVLHELQFADREHLSRSVQELLDSEGVEDCLIEADQLRLRFVAPKAVAASLIERLYLHGGLTWCARHVIAPSP